MTRLALIAVNAKYSHTNLALLYLRAALLTETPNIDFELIEWDINRPERELLETITAGGFSHAVFSVYIWNSRYIEDIVSDLNQFSRRPIICAGGPEVVHNRTVWLQIPGLDFILNGAAEHFIQILQKLKKPESARVLHAAAEPFSRTVFPYDEPLLENLRGRLIYYEASRGCMFGCSYCLSSCSDNPVEYRTANQIITEITLLSTFTGTVKFVDRTFNANPEVSRLIWQYMANNPIAGCFHFEIHPLLLEEEDLRLLKNLPQSSAQLEIGIQSSDSAVLKNVNRAGEWSKEKKIIKELVNTGLFHIHLDQIVGLPGDTPEAASVSLDEIMQLLPDHFQLGFLKLLPGTPLFEQKEKWGIKNSMTPPNEILESSSFSFEQLQYFHLIEKLISRLYNSGFFTLTLKHLVGESGSWYRLFKDLLKTDPDLSCRRWEYWGKILMDYADTNHPEGKNLFIDLLRFDWCPFSNAQYYPDFLKYGDREKITILRRIGVERLRKEQPGIKKSNLNRAILFVPENPELSKTEAAIFYKEDSSKKRIDLSDIQL